MIRKMVQKDFYFPPLRVSKREEPAWIAGFIWGAFAGITIFAIILEIAGFLIWGVV